MRRLPLSRRSTYRGEGRRIEAPDHVGIVVHDRDVPDRHEVDVDRCDGRQQHAGLGVRGPRDVLGDRGKKGGSRWRGGRKIAGVGDCQPPDPSVSPRGCICCVELQTEDGQRVGCRVFRQLSIPEIVQARTGNGHPRRLISHHRRSGRAARGTSWSSRLSHATSSISSPLCVGVVGVRRGGGGAGEDELVRAVRHRAVRHRAVPSPCAVRRRAVRRRAVRRRARLAVRAFRVRSRRRCSRSSSPETSKPKDRGLRMPCRSRHCLPRRSTGICPPESPLLVTLIQARTIPQYR